MRTHAPKTAKDASPETVFQSKEFKAFAQFHLRDRRLRKYYREWSPLHRAVWQEDLVAVICLATKHSVKAVDARGCTPLHLACLRKGSILFLSSYCEKYCIENRHHHCFPGRWGDRVKARQIAAALIEAGADPNAMARGPFAFTPMHCVANSGWVDVAHVLLENGGSAFSRGQCSPFCWADGIDISGSYTTTMRELLKAHLSEAQKREINDHHVHQGFKVLPW